jgi:hypothetical protein
MVEIMTREASSCDLKELVGKFIPESIGTSTAARGYGQHLHVRMVELPAYVLSLASSGHCDSQAVFLQRSTAGWLLLDDCCSACWHLLPVGLR